MAKQKEEWIELAEAVRLMSEKHGRPIAPGFITRLALDGKLTTKPKDRRSNLYLKSEILAYEIRQKGKGKGKKDVPTAESDMV